MPAKTGTKKYEDLKSFMSNGKKLIKDWNIEGKAASEFKNQLTKTKMLLGKFSEQVEADKDVKILNFQHESLTGIVRSTTRTAAGYNKAKKKKETIFKAVQDYEKNADGDVSSDTRYKRLLSALQGANKECEQAKLKSDQAAVAARQLNSVEKRLGAARDTAAKKIKIEAKSDGRKITVKMGQIECISISLT